MVAVDITNLWMRKKSGNDTSEGEMCSSAIGIYHHADPAGQLVGEVNRSYGTVLCSAMHVRYSHDHARSQLRTTPLFLFLFEGGDGVPGFLCSTPFL